MSDAPGGPGWWQAADGKWYPPAGTPAPPPGVDTTKGAPTGGYTPPPGATPPPPPGAYGPSTAPPGAPPPGAFPPAGGYPPPPPGGGYPPPPGGYGGPKKGGNGGVIAIVAIFVVVVLVAGAAAVLLTRDSGDDVTDGTTTPESDGEPLVLQKAGDEGPDPFGASFTDGGLPDLSNEARDVAESVRSGMSSDGASGALIGTGSDPGLYGGSRDNQICDAAAIGEFLEGDTAKAEAFAGVLDISAADIPDYLGGLTPVILASDTWVTNHGFADGEATEFQAVLEAGTAVLIDDTGTPRVRCSCGNPLTPPARPDHSTESTDGDEWDGYDPDQVTVIEPGDTLSSLTLIDAETGEEFDRAVGSGQTGDVQVTLRWSGDADLDLHVFDPDGFEIYFSEPSSPSGGELDVDVIPGCDTPTETNTENVFWASGSAPDGDYRVVVENYDGCDAATAGFEIQVVVAGAVEVDEFGSVAAGEPSDEFTFSV